MSSSSHTQHARVRHTRSPDTGSRTMTVSPTPETNEAGPSTQPQHAIGTLRLRGGPTRRAKVKWTDETVDNEGMGKKKSKICCIYHKPKAYDESSSESESDNEPPKKQYPKGSGHALKKRSEKDASVESSESDGGAGNGTARPIRRPKHDPCNHPHPPGDENKPAKANKYDQEK